MQFHAKPLRDQFDVWTLVDRWKVWKEDRQGA
jgi:hypothetical protein